MFSFNSIRKHLRQGTLLDAVFSRLGGVVPAYTKVRWLGADDPSEAARGLAKQARILVTADPGGDAWVLCIGDDGEFHRMLNERLRQESVKFRSHPLEQLRDWQSADAKGLAAVICGYADSRRMTLAARQMSLHPVFSNVPFEYAPGIDPAKAAFGRLDEYADTFFVSPVLLEQRTPYEIYEESLQHFEQKCGLRDYLDLYQLLRHVVDNRVSGDIAEFGSYKGHSGWLIARTLQSLGSDKRLYMFDTFESFPVESIGVDHFWNKTHYVDFAEVQRKLSAFPGVTLVRGDFTKTLDSSGVGQLALAYVDCDSYRATRYLIEALLDDRIPRHGLLVCEDYGHPALLGNRAAVQESLEGKTGLFRYFSQFSGYYVVLKL